MLQETDVKEIKKTKKKIFSCIFQINLKMSGTDNFLRKWALFWLMKKETEKSKHRPRNKKLRNFQRATHNTRTVL